VKPGILDVVHVVCKNVEQSSGYPGRAKPSILDAVHVLSSNVSKAWVTPGGPQPQGPGGNPSEANSNPKAGR
jgi:hypothetical protein